MERSRRGLALILRDNDSQVRGKCFILAFKSFSPYSPKTQASTSLPNSSQSTPLLSWAPPQAALFSHAICDTSVHSQRHRGNQSPQRPGRLVPFPPPSDSPFNTNHACWKQPKSLQRPVTPNQSLLGASRPEGPHTQDVHTPPVASSPPRPHTDTHTAVPHTPCCYEQQTLSEYLFPPPLGRDHLSTLPTALPEPSEPPV